ncbi:hypothetical protein GmHk_07G019087 [Glycine max]|nr:hypothetical protein GmHk_07G019087 [Glycine max]
MPSWVSHLQKVTSSTAGTIAMFHVNYFPFVACADTRNLSNLLLAIPLGLYYIYFLPTCGTSSTYRSAIHSLKSLMILSLCCLWLDHTLLEADLMLLRSPTIHHNPPKFAFLSHLLQSNGLRHCSGNILLPCISAEMMVLADFCGTAVPFSSPILS